MKTCQRCRQVLPIEAFYADRTRPDGHGYACQDCHNERVGEYRRRVRAARKPVRPTTDVDDAAVRRAVAGDPPADLTPAERRAAVSDLTRRGLTADQIAELLHVVQRTVTRARTRTGAVPEHCQECLGPSCRWHRAAA